MKKIYFIVATLFAANVSAQFVGLENLTLPTANTYWNGDDLTGNFNSGPVQFQNNYNSNWMYWDAGFAYSNQVSDTMTGINGQYSSYAGGGAGGSAIYGIGQNGAYLTLNNPNATITNISITNTNYAASSMLTGDQFAKQFGGPTGNDPDFLLLTIKRYHIGNFVDSTEFYLADYTFANNAQDYIVKNWTNISFLFSNGPVDSLTFSMSSTDNAGSWMNTPGFFAIDNITIDAFSGINTFSSEFSLYPNPTSNVLNIKSNNSLQSYSITNLQGKIVKRGLLNNSSAINVENLPVGFYQINVATNIGSSTQKFIKH